MRKIVMLDFDGVLNSTCWADRPDHPSIEEIFRRVNDGSCTPDFLAKLLDPECTRRLLKILEAVPELEIVLSTSWRLQMSTHMIKAVLASHGIPDRIVGLTPSKISGLSREDEIARWIEANDPTHGHRYLILDDLPLKLKPHHRHSAMTPSRLNLMRAAFLKTDPESGLMDADVERALRILS